MTQEALKLALEALEGFIPYLPLKDEAQCNRYDKAIVAIKEALAQEQEQEPVKIAHRHEWFRTGEMKVGQMRCISCGTWGHEEMPQRPWVGLTELEKAELWGRDAVIPFSYADAIEAKLKEKNT